MARLPPNDFCFASIDSTPTAGIQIHGDTMDVSIRADALPLPLPGFDAVVGLRIQPDGNCASALAVLVMS